MLRWNPAVSCLFGLWYLLTGRLRFWRESEGRVIISPDGRRFVVFRHATLALPTGSGVTFVVRFRLARVDLERNIRFSLLPIPFFTGLPGFHSKHWLVCYESGEFQGVYRWARQIDAERYARSFAMDFMTRRSVPSSVSWSIESGDYCEALGLGDRPPA